MRSLDLGIIGNGTIGALIDSRAEIVWSCFPRLDADPLLCSLLRERHGKNDFGFFAIDLVDLADSQQHYVGNTAILVTTLQDKHSDRIEVTDFMPRFYQYGRVFRPLGLVRRIRRRR